jgi:hypothetical protein
MLTKKYRTRTTQMTMKEVTRTKTVQQEITMIPPLVPSMKKHKTAADKDQGKELPMTMVTIYKSSEQSLMSSIRIGEFGMITSKKGMTKPFAMAVREHLF